jgi:hypothetical protein
VSSFIDDSRPSSSLLISPLRSTNFLASLDSNYPNQQHQLADHDGGGGFLELDPLPDADPYMFGLGQHEGLADLFSSSNWDEFGQQQQHSP